ncbi:MAG: FtsX-like permease family protein [Candidatus Thorarchaeota archaeon]
MFRYAIKRVARSYRLFVALTLGVLVATTFFASTNVAADLLARDALQASLDGVMYDMTVNSPEVSTAGFFGFGPVDTTIKYSDWNSTIFEEVETEISDLSGITGLTHTSSLTFDYNNSGHDIDIVGMQWDSDFTDGLSLLSGRSSLGPNETYVVVGSVNETEFQIDDIITVPINYEINTSLIPQTMEWNFTIAGFVDMPTNQRSALAGDQTAGLFRAFGQGFTSSFNLMVTNWSTTMEPLIESFVGLEGVTGVAIQNSVHVKIDRASMLNPYDIAASQDRIGQVENRVLRVVEVYGANVASGLTIPLIAYQLISLMMNLTFIGLAIPIFFMAYFTGTMVSEVGYNLRRREIGLLLTKGITPTSVRRMLLIEGAIVGAVAGGLSLLLGSAIAYVVTGTSSISYLAVLSNNSTSFILSIILGMFLALFSVWRPSNRASRLEILDALKQYVFIEETSQYKKLLPTLTFVLGTYKLIVWVLGIDMNVLLTSLNLGNFLLAIGVIVWVMIDSILNFLGPIFFLFGSTKLFMRGSHRFQEAVVNAGKRFFGAFGNLATRNVKRNPSRNAAMVFIVSLIVSYGVFTIGNLYSEYDRVERNAFFDVGSDVSIDLDNGANLTEIENEVEEFEGVLDTTPEFEITLNSGSTSIDTRGIRPDDWSSIAFWEPGWFIGDFNQMIDDLGDDGIILSVTLANELEVEVGENFTVRGPFDTGFFNVRVVGLVGYQSILETFIEGFGVSAGGSYPSFVSETFLNDTSLLPFASTKLLIDTQDGINGTIMQEQIMDEVGDISSTYSVTAQIKDYYERPIESGTIKMTWVAIFFSIVLAMVGTGLVIILSLREKNTEIALLTVRGFSKWQLFKTLFAEVMVMVFFALLLGSLVGFIQIFGNVSSLNGGLTGLVRYQMVLGPPGLAWWSVIGTVLLASIFPVWWVSRRPEAEVDALRG